MILIPEYWKIETEVSHWELVSALSPHWRMYNIQQELFQMFRELGLTPLEYYEEQMADKSAYKFTMRYFRKEST